MKISSYLLSFLVLIPTLSSSLHGQETEEWNFKVTVDGNLIGKHQFKKKQEAGLTIVTSNAKFDVKILFVNILKYRHQNREVWEEGCLSKIESTTRSNKKKFKVSGSKHNESFSIDTLAENTIHQGCLYTFAYWNPDFLLQDRLVNSQTGEIEEVTVSRLDTESNSLTGYLVNAKEGPIKVWYEDETWIGLESTLKNGRTLRYEIDSQT
ncbi:MAG: DUF6134 family protein [Candidatus Azotimanducaceae bacterium]